MIQNSVESLFVSKSRHIQLIRRLFKLDATHKDTVTNQPKH